MATEPPATVAREPGFLGAFARIGLYSFGGPAAQIALMHRVLVEETRWLSEERFLKALSFCMLLPGPEAMQLATYAGWRLRGVAGGLIAGLLFVVPGAVVIFALATLYVRFGQLPWVDAAFLSVKAAVLAIVVRAMVRLVAKALRARWHVALALAAFAALFVFDLPFPLVADPDRTIQEAYGVYGEKSFYGKTIVGVKRTTFLIEPDGTIRHVFKRPKTAAHAEEIMAKL